MKILIGLVLLLLLITTPLVANSNYVGEEPCQSCHQKEHLSWKGSHHDLAMQEANEDTVLGNFNNLSVKFNEVNTKFFKVDDRFMVNTDGPDGKLYDYEISYTFGVYPLQQYMVKFPNGKIQVLSIAWDSREKSEGGQRWFSLNPDEIIKAGDVLHWTGPNLNWNYMCADCHSTNLIKNYSESNRSYNTKWDSINVSCEACHGPAASHVSWANTKAKSSTNGLTVHFPPSNNRWQINQQTNKPELIHSSELKANKAEIEICAKCHSRRSQLDDKFTPGDNFRDHYLPSLLGEPLYYSDGQINDEVYVYGSFQQSKMYAKGVRCSDCHEPHSLKLKAEGDRVCSQCHLPANYSTKKHHFHNLESAGASCVSCHMPGNTYMGVDVRNDHSFRIPRPDLSTQLGTPNACINCHKEKENTWAEKTIKQWYKKTPVGYQQFGNAIHSLQHDGDNALQLTYDVLRDSTSNIAKSTLVGHLGSYASRQTLMTVLQMLRSKDADIRRQALTAAEAFPLQHTLIEIFKKLEDPVKIVRIEAARILSAVSPGELNNQQNALLNKVTEEYRQSLLFSADRPESQLALAQLYLNLGEYERAVVAFKEALILQPQYVPSYVNYANYLQNISEESAFDMLQLGLKQSKDASLYHALGLWYIRNNQKQQGVFHIRKAAILVPENMRFQYVYAIAMGDSSPEIAITILESSLKNHSGNIDLLSALASYYKKVGNQEKTADIQQKIRSIIQIK